MRSSTLAVDMGPQKLVMPDTPRMLKSLLSIRQTGLLEQVSVTFAIILVSGRTVKSFLALQHHGLFSTSPSYYAIPNLFGNFGNVENVKNFGNFGAFLIGPEEFSKFPKLSKFPCGQDRKKLGEL